MKFHASFSMNLDSIMISHQNRIAILFLLVRRKQRSVVTHMYGSPRIQPPIRGLCYCSHVCFSNHRNAPLRNHSNNVFRFLFDHIGPFGVGIRIGIGSASFFPFFLLVSAFTCFVALLSIIKAFSKKFLLEFSIIIGFQDTFAFAFVFVVLTSFSDIDIGIMRFWIT